MSPTAVLRRCAPAVTAVALVLTTAACAGTPPNAAGAPGSSTGASSPAAGSSVHQITIRFGNGQVSGDTGRVTVKSGEQVRLTVTSDVDDEVHVHGYNLMQDVAPDRPATITFQANVPGVFEVELEHLGKQLLTFQVS